MCWLRSCCGVAEGADVPLSHSGTADPSSSSSSSRCPPAVCVAVVLGDALRRVSVLGGREGMPRSLGSVYGGSVTRFLGGGCRGVVSRVIDTPGVKSMNGVAVSRDGSTLLVSDSSGGSHPIHEFAIADGSRRRVVGKRGNKRLEFTNPCQLWIASDGFVFVADHGNDRVQVLTVVGVGHLNHPWGVCANDDVVVVSDNSHRISVFRRDGGAVVRRFGRQGSGDSHLHCPKVLCFVSGDRHIAVADCYNDRVSVFTVEGEFIRHVGVGVLQYPCGVACSAGDELVVADNGSRRVVVFSVSGDVAMTFGDDFTCVAMHGGTIVAYVHSGLKCVLFH
jgi:hypothetical protein